MIPDRFILKNFLIRKEFAKEIFIVLVFFGSLIANQISNYKPSSFLIKIIMLLLMIPAGIMIYGTESQKIKEAIYQKKIRILNLISAVFLIYPLVTLVYSVNPWFGFLKSINLFISSIPLVYFGLLLVITVNNLRIKIFQWLLTGLGIILSLLVIIIYPFDHLTIYSFSPSRLSHVTAGRILGIAYITALISFFFSKSVKEMAGYAALLTLIGFAAYLTALRSSLLGLALVLFVVFIYLFQEDKNFKKPGMLLISVTFTVLLVSLSSNNFYGTSQERLGDMISVNVESGDGGIKSRAYLFNKSFDLITQNPWLGTGWGGFINSEAGIINQMTYPHNIILEGYTEFGIFAGSFFTLLILITLCRSYRSNKMFFLFILYAFIISMFSKDITTNGIFWLGLMALTSANPEPDNSSYSPDTYKSKESR